ncbi:hypothetical protein DFH29DRAFT_1079544 [Suillus ampliporus]|nr:hypothetical protein DFH29DRAFT_1079544 [Suillus ampliporus]
MPTAVATATTMTMTTVSTEVPFNTGENGIPPHLFLENLPPRSFEVPHQILITLVASTLKIDCPDIGRKITEDWLSKCGQYDFVPSTGEPHHKVLELYCLHAPRKFQRKLHLYLPYYPRSINRQ